ncbi:MAG: lytic transglycosylase domain-containing protein [Paracoccaceae bacterium]
MKTRMFAVTLVLAVALGVPAAAGPKPFPDFSAKRVKPPSPGTGKRITIQIEPQPEVTVPEATPETETASASVPASTIGNYTWFWDAVSPELTQSGPGRLEKAMFTLQANGSVAAPRLQDMQNIALENGIEILKSTIGTKVSPALVLAVISVESSGRPDAVSSAGAQGLMQLMPATADRFGVTDALLPNENIGGGVKYLDWLMEEFGGDPILVLAGYNAGEGSVRKHGGVPPYAETRDYVPKVLSAFQVARGLCKTPPELISDGCVFAAMN